MKEAKDSNIVLLDLPKVLFVEMLTPMEKQYEGLGTNVFPMRPLQTCWHLDRECTVEIWRKGFPLVPNFSSTVDSATGQTLRAAVPDLGDEYCPPSHTGATSLYLVFVKPTAC